MLPGLCILCIATFICSVWFFILLVAFPLVSQPLAATTTNTTTTTTTTTTTNTTTTTTTTTTTAAAATAIITTAAVAPIQPDILWICASDKLYQLAKDEGHVSTLQVARMTPDRHFEYLVWMIVLWGHSLCLLLVNFYSGVRAASWYEGDLPCSWKPFEISNSLADASYTLWPSQASKCV